MGVYIVGNLWVRNIKLTILCDVRFWLIESTPKNNSNCMIYFFSSFIKKKNMHVDLLQTVNDQLCSNVCTQSLS